MEVSAIMKKEFIYFDFTDTLPYAIKKMAEGNFSSAPVIRKGKLRGMLLTSNLAAAIVKTNVFSKPSFVSMDKVKEEMVGRHADKGIIWQTLTPESDIVDAFLVSAKTGVSVIPVVDKNKKMVGVVYASDLRKEMAKMLITGKAPKSAIESREGVGGDDEDKETTPIDEIVKLVNEKGSILAKDAAHQCKLNVTEVEEYANSLAKKRIIKIEYDILGRMRLIKLK